MCPNFVSTTLKYTTGCRDLTAPDLTGGPVAEQRVHRAYHTHRTLMSYTLPVSGHNVMAHCYIEISALSDVFQSFWKSAFPALL